MTTSNSAPHEFITTVKKRFGRTPSTLDSAYMVTNTRQVHANMLPENLRVRSRAQHWNAGREVESQSSQENALLIETPFYSSTY